MRRLAPTLCLVPSLLAQNPADPAPPQDPPAPQQPARRTAPVVVTATRTEKDPFDLPYSTSTITATDVTTRLQSRTTPQTLKETPGVSVQQTAHGQGSPKIRGQTGFQTLLLVDGIRLNDSTWRSGNVEYWNHLDPYSFDRFEVLRGPSSVLWGSDAVSGVGHAFAKGNTSFEPGLHATGSLLGRYASAENSFVGRVESRGNADDFGWHVGFSAKDFDDLQLGRDVGLLEYSGYDERDGDAKLTWRIGEHQRLSFGVQTVHLADVPRTHSTVFGIAGWRGTVAGSDLQREHDHRRQLYWVDWQVEPCFADRLTLKAGFKERYEREYRRRSNGRSLWNAMTVETPFVTAQAEHSLGAGALTWGADWYLDVVASDAREFNADGSLRSTANRGVVAGDAEYGMFGLFAQYDVPLGERFELIAGARYSNVQLDAQQVDVPGDSVTFDDLKDDWDAVTGSLRLLWKPAASWRAFGGVSQGFRAPNLSDTTRFDVGRSGELEVPAQGLGEEEYTTFELGGRYDDGRVALAATAWYTLAEDQISRFRTGNVIGGLPEVSKANVSDGWYAGFEVEGSYGLAGLGLEDWSMFGFLDWVDGRIDQLVASGAQTRADAPALPPPTGMLGLRWQDPDRERGFEAYSRLAYHVHASGYTQAEATNPERIPPGGLPGYAVVGMRGWLPVGERVTASLAIENLGDVDYRLMDSGLNEPGTNVILTLQARF